MAAAAAVGSGFSAAVAGSRRSFPVLDRAATVMGLFLFRLGRDAGAGARQGPKKDKMCEKVIATAGYDDYYMGFNRRIE